MKVGSLIDQIDIFNKYPSPNARGPATHESEGALAVKTSPHAVPGDAEASEITDRLNDIISRLQDRVSFSYNDKIKRIILRIIDNDTQEVIREIPSKDAVKLLEHLQEHIGVIFDESR